MKALVVGGTGFLGGAIANYAASRGFDVTVLTRQNISRGDEKITYLIGDRYANLPDLNQMTFDVVFDTCAFEPFALNILLDKLNLESIKKYVFISSASVYEDYSEPNLSEEAIIGRATEEDYDLANGLPFSERTQASSFSESYGRLKRECELVALERLGEKALILRSGLLVGAGDYTDRLTWWVRNLDQSGIVACPLPKERPIQLIDVRDAAKFAVKAAFEGQSGVINLTGHQVSFYQLMSQIIECTMQSIEIKWVDETKYYKLNLNPWTDIPLIIPPDKQLKYFFDISIDAARMAGLELVDIKETIINILDWDRINRTRKLKCGYGFESNEKLLK